MKQKRKFPVVMNYWLNQQLERRALIISRNLEKIVFPILRRFGIASDESIRKYLLCSTYKDIFSDAQTLHPEIISLLDYDAFNERDVYKEIREASCKIKSPTQEGFVFAKNPIYCSDKRVLDSLTVEKGRITINTALLRELSIVRPTPPQQDLYDYVADFIEGLGNYPKRTLQELFLLENGKLVPNARGILACHT